MMKISAAFMLFAAHRAHNMNEPLMYVWLCFNNIFCRFLVRGRVGNFPLTTAHNAKIKQHTAKWRVNEKIIVQFQVLIKISWFLLDNRVIICRIFTWLRNFFDSIHFCYFFFQLFRLIESPQNSLLFCSFRRAITHNPKCRDIRK